MANEIDDSGNNSGSDRIAPPHVLHFILQKSLCAGAAPHPWFQARRRAEKTLLQLSEGELVLLSQGYSGDDQRHQIVHTACERPFWASVEEVQRIGASRICPYCNITDNLARIGTVEQIQHYVIDASESRAYFYAANVIGSPVALYDFLCMLHKKPFRASFSEFQRMQGGTNGCPLCQAESR